MMLWLLLGIYDADTVEIFDIVPLRFGTMKRGKKVKRGSRGTGCRPRGGTGLPAP